MKSRTNFFLKIIFAFGLICLFLYCEYIIYFIVLKDCNYPELDIRNRDRAIKSNDEEPVKVMVLADTHLIGSRTGYWFDKLHSEWRMYRAFQTAMILHKPDLVFVLGDLTDEGLYCSGDEFDYYVKRFYSLFSVPEGTELHVAVGNHDIGFHHEISPYSNERFVTGFNAPSVQFISVKGNHFVLVNSMALEGDGDGCFLCRSAEEHISKIEKLLKCAKGMYGDECDSVDKLYSYSKPILMQHFPLYRLSDAECDDLDAAPMPLKKDIFRESLDCLSQEATDQLLKQLQPRLAISGHVHHGCTRKLPTGDGLEITVPSFSWRNKGNPTYSLAVFTPDNYGISKCPMPKESTVIKLYFLGLSCLLLWFTYTNYSNFKCRKFKIIKTVYAKI